MIALGQAKPRTLTSAPRRGTTSASGRCLFGHMRARIVARGRTGRRADHRICSPGNCTVISSHDRHDAKLHQGRPLRRGRDFAQRPAAAHSADVSKRGSGFEVRCGGISTGTHSGYHRSQSQSGNRRSLQGQQMSEPFAGGRKRWGNRPESLPLFQSNGKVGPGDTLTGRRASGPLTHARGRRSRMGLGIFARMSPKSDRVSTPVLA